MANLKENYHFSRFRRGSNIFQRGGGVWGPTFSRGVQLFPGGSNCLFPIETKLTCDFPAVSGPPVPPPPPWIRTWNIQIVRLNDQLLRCFSPARFSHSYLYIWDHPLYIFKGAQVGIPNEL